jgi:hypothetical protein
MAAMLALLADVKAVFCVRIGHTPWQQLELQGIEPRGRRVAFGRRGAARWWQQRRQSWRHRVASGGRLMAPVDWLTRLWLMYHAGKGCFPLRMGLTPRLAALQRGWARWRRRWTARR